MIYVSRSYDFSVQHFMQVVLTSTNPSELCINGMSFSRRSSRWANAALVATVSSKDFEALNLNGPLAGVEFQVLMGLKKFFKYLTFFYLFLALSSVSFLYDI